MRGVFAVKDEDEGGVSPGLHGAIAEEGWGHPRRSLPRASLTAMGALAPERKLLGERSDIASTVFCVRDVQGDEVRRTGAKRSPEQPDPQGGRPYDNHRIGFKQNFIISYENL